MWTKKFIFSLNLFYLHVFYAQINKKLKELEVHKFSVEKHFSAMFSIVSSQMT
jgi:hypothetical protein